MDNVRFFDQLQQGCRALGVGVGEEVPAKLFRLMNELIKWNAKVNLTAITAPDEVLEKHFLDSLAVLPEVEGAASWTSALAPVSPDCHSSWRGPRLP